MDGQKIFVSTVGDDSGDGSDEEHLTKLENTLEATKETRDV